MTTESDASVQAHAGLVKPWKKRLRRYADHKTLLLMLLPGFCVFLLFHYVPLYGITIAFKQFQIREGILNSPWVGLEHFQRLFAGDGFSNAIRNTVIIALLKLVFVFPAPIILAIMLNEVRSGWFRRLVQTVSYLPHFFSWVILAGIMFTFLGTDGAFNHVMSLFGLPQHNWLLESGKFYGIIVITAIWQSVGWSSIVFFAALASIDPTLYEAAIADGAGRWRRIWHITLPGIAPTIIIMLLMYIGHFLSVGFDQVYNLTTATTSDVADILDTYVLRRLLTMDYELGAAAGIFSSVIGLGLVMLGNRLVKLYDREQGLW
ncbi:sugar ABC transporter permease [Paenibacillus sp. YN15]|uniref:ABC transporter permease n=1 Tax=Paenibacillus sp. YN15 TaxID=1742774 RepID=UPI000DCEBAF5|nr:ABC transporter permease subunit [Paenibacillus sp. YN15]RAV06383.1 sugar ABC transporter permease [Paenibacillus sp. YN15]